VRSSLANNARNLEIHESIVAYIRQQVGTTGNGKGTVLALEIQRKSLFSKTSGRRDKVRDRIANPGSVVRIGNNNHFRVLVAKNTTLQKGRLPGSAALEETPHRTGFEKGFNAKRGSPVKIARAILSIAEASANRNDSFMLIVSERNKDVNNAGTRLSKCRTARQSSQRDKTHDNDNY
jgi:hypothetical protein